MGKGSKRRPMRVGADEFAENWARIFRERAEAVEVVGSSLRYSNPRRVGRRNTSGKGGTSVE